jgi:membrane protein implicated in regulation of membrane protease activity
MNPIPTAVIIAIVLLACLILQPIASSLWRALKSWLAYRWVRQVQERQNLEQMRRDHDRD